MKQQIQIPNATERTTNWTLLTSWNRDNMIGIGGMNALMSRDVWQNKTNPDKYLLHESYATSPQRAYLCDSGSVAEYLQ